MHHRAKKRFGQNFLVDASIIEKILQSVNPQADDAVVEIGPGLGALTQPLLKTVPVLDVIELDRDVIPVLKKLEQSHKLRIHNTDVLKFNFTEADRESSGGRSLRIIGNLPYNISTAVLFHLIKHRDIIKDMHFMLQKEVVERIAAEPGAHNYGRLTVMLQLYFDAVPLFTVPPESFRPVPAVESAIIRLTPKTGLPISAVEHDNFEALIRQAFSQRRKTLKNTLKGLCSTEQMQAAGINPGNRPQELDINDFVRLFRQLY
jgi:16S rRNA (adenine1518-N6/adenine1519-N6)-dimethyltransferase